jgi:hypothetical protein
MTPYFCATCEMALATPELTPPTMKATLSCLIMRSAMREPVAGVVSVSMCTYLMGRPSTPPLAFISSMAMITPRLSESPLLAYWPLASAVMPIRIGALPEGASAEPAPAAPAFLLQPAESNPSAATTERLRRQRFIF